MPRMENAGPAVDLWYETEARGNGSSTFDVCRPCGRKYEGKPLPASLQPYNGDPTGVLEGDCDAPDIEDWDRRCEICDVTLTARNY